MNCNEIITRSPKHSLSAWFGFGMDAMLFGIDAAAVVLLRTSRVVAGGAPAHTELKRMVSEKVDAHAAFGAAVLGGRVGADPLALGNALIGHYGPRVRANRHRLSRP